MIGSVWTPFEVVCHQFSLVGKRLNVIFRRLRGVRWTDGARRWYYRVTHQPRNIPPLIKDAVSCAQAHVIPCSQICLSRFSSDSVVYQVYARRHALRVGRGHFRRTGICGMGVSIMVVFPSRRKPRPLFMRLLTRGGLFPTQSLVWIKTKVQPDVEIDGLGTHTKRVAQRQ